MRPLKDKITFIKNRAEGKSYTKICKELSISKATCSKWEQELQKDITAYKQDQLEDLYSQYFMTKEARIKTLGETLEKIQQALSLQELACLPADKLLDHKLKYLEALKAEHIDPSKEKAIFSGGNVTINLLPD